MKKPFISKKSFKQRANKCHICGENKYELLDIHRIKAGAEGGKYEEPNCVSICTSCHRKHHANIITIKQWYNSTKGKILYYIDERGDEQFT